MTKQKRCPVCVQGVLVGQATNEAVPFRHSPGLAPARPVPVPTCSVCGERFIDAATARALDAALEDALATHQRHLLEGGLAALARAHAPREWEKRLGLSPGYFSRLKSGKESSVVLTTLVAMLGDAPGLAWDRVGALWSTRPNASPDPVEAPAGNTAQVRLRLVASNPAASVAVSAPMQVVNPALTLVVPTEAA